MARGLVRASVALAILVVVAAGGYGWLRSSLPAAGNSVPIAGLGDAVEVLRDAFGVPHIFARSFEDAAAALGYVHAQDRLWQMESMRRLGAGRLSEIVGPRAVETDRLLRTLGLYRLAERQIEQLSPELLRVLAAYAAGVNAHLDRHGGALPPEFLLLRRHPEPWRVADTLVWGKLMAWRLSTNRHDELLRARLARRLTERQIAELWPPYPPDAPTTLGAAAELARTLPLDRLALIDPPGPEARQGASNALVLSGTRTTTGKPILVNDPHLPLAAPGTWYLARIDTPELRLAGATAAGAPLVLFGHNGRIAWGFTAGGGDVEDLFIERPDPSSAGRYLTPEGPRPFAVRDEIVRVRGADDVPLRIRETRHGPVVSDVLAAPEGAETTDLLAPSAPYLIAEDGTADALFRLNAATGWDDVVAAVRRFHSSHQNLVYADVEGTIGFLSVGRIPIRRQGRGRVPASGWTGEFDWQGFVPADSLPRLLNPASGVIVNANNGIVPEGFPWYLGEDWEDGFRAQRLLDLATARGRHSLDTAAEIPLDTLSLMARRLLPLMLAALPAEARDNDALELLRAWSGRMDRGRPEPLIFLAWLRAFNEAVYADELGPDFEAYWGQRARFITFVLTEGRTWCDDVTTPRREDCGGRLAVALDRALAMLRDRLGPDPKVWRWGDVHRALFHHRLFDAVPLVRHLANREIATDGGYHTLNRGAMRLGDRDRPFAHVHGAGFRAVYDLADLARSRFAVALGQSGNPLSPHYDDQLERWRDGAWMELGAERETLRASARSRLLLVPAEKGSR